MKHLCYLFLLYKILQLSSAVKIGISRPDLTTATTTTTTTNASNMTTELPDISSTSLLAETTSSEMISSSTIDESTTLKSVAPTTLPALTTTLSATKTTQIKVVTIKPKIKPTIPTTKTTTTTTTTTTESTKLETISTNDSDNLTTSEIHETISSHALHHVYCDCNLLTNECDINCCCDQDCSKETLQIFDCHVPPAHPELRERLEDFQYQHSLPSCKINDGWLCVFRSNAKVAQEESPNLITDTSNLYKWSSLMLEAVSPESVADNEQHYKYGASMQLINLDTMHIKNFELPYAFIGERCQIKEPIEYLKSTRRHCQINSLDELLQQKHEILVNLSGFKLLKRPFAQMLDADKTEDSLLEIKITRCVYQGNAKDECEAEQSTELEVENYYALEIELIFRHNFTQLFECELKLKEHKILSNATEVKEPEYWQAFVVKFQLFKEKNKQSKRRGQGEEEQAISGALGYLQGQPIIMAHFVAYNASLEMRDDNRVLNYFQPNANKLRSDHSLLLMSRRHELCYKNAAKQNYINYGINVLKQCKVRLENTTHLSENPSEQNFTVICVALQELAMQQLLAANRMQQVWISQLGKPENNTEHKWTLLQWKNFDFEPVVGVYNEQFQTFTCRNILLNVIYEFQVGSFMVNGVAHQNLVKQATLTTGSRHDLEFALTEALELPLNVAVMFYDYASNVKQQLSSAAGAIFIKSLLYFCALLVLVL